MKLPLRFALCLCVMTLGAFSNSFDGVFVFDDALHIVGNPRIRSLDPFWAPFLGTTRPLVQASLALNYALSGLEPWSYHLFNLLLHGAAALALFGILRRVFARQSATAPTADALGFCAAALWAVHPLQTESVTYVIQRAEVGMGLCVLLSIYGLLRALESPRPGRWLLFSAAACLLGYGFKPIMAVTPVLVWLFDRCFLSGSFRAALKARPGYYAALALSPAILPVILAGSASEWSTTAGFGCLNVNAFEYARTQPEVILHYLKLTVWPSPLCLDYGWPIQDSWARIGLSAGMILGLMALSIFALRRRPAWGFVGAWFFLNLAPTSSVVPISDLAFEHRMYLALASLLAGAVAAVHLGIRRVAPDISPVVRPLMAGAALLFLASFTMIRNADYHSELGMLSANVLERPRNPRPHLNLATALIKADKSEAGFREFERAIILKPNFGVAWHQYGMARLRLGQPQKALDCLETAALIRPEDWEVQNGLGLALAALGREDAALGRFEEALRLYPKGAGIHLNLATLFARRGEAQKAAVHRAEAVRMAPGLARLPAEPSAGAP